MKPKNNLTGWLVLCSALSLLLLIPTGDSRGVAAALPAGYGQEEGASNAYLPITHNNYCGNYFDDFGDPFSGWYVNNGHEVKSEYLDGEFRVLSFFSGYMFVYLSPACPSKAYEVTVDARWVNATGESYGVIVGLPEDGRQYYLVEVNPDRQMYSITFPNSSSRGSVIADPTYSAAIHPGQESNHIQVGFSGPDGRIWLTINGQWIKSFGAALDESRTYSALVMISAEGKPPAEARFDNFRRIQWLERSP